MSIKLDNIDRANIDHIVDNYSRIKKTLENYSIIPVPEFFALDRGMDIEIDITFKQAKYDEDNTYDSYYSDSVPDYIKFYLEYYHAVNEAITVYNEDNTDHIAPLENTFSMLRSEEHTSELQSHYDLVCRLLLEKKKNAYLFATMIMTSVSSPFSCCSGIVRLNLM